MNETQPGIDKGLAYGQASRVEPPSSLFMKCVQCFDQIEAPQSSEWDFDIVTRLAIEKQRLVFWGDRYGILEMDAWTPLRPSASVVQPMLTAIYDLFGNIDEITSDYGCSRHTILQDQEQQQANPLMLFPTKHDALLAFPNSGNQTSSRKLKWVVINRDKFAKFMSGLRDLVNGLNSIATPLVSSRQDEMVKNIPAMFSNTGNFKLVAEACRDDHHADDTSWNERGIGMAYQKGSAIWSGSTEVHVARIHDWMDQFPKTLSEPVSASEPVSTRLRHGGRLKKQEKSSVQAVERLVKKRKSQDNPSDDESTYRLRKRHRISASPMDNPTPGIANENIEYYSSESSWLVSEEFGCPGSSADTDTALFRENTFSSRAPGLPNFNSPLLSALDTPVNCEVSQDDSSIPPERLGVYKAFYEEVCDDAGRVSLSSFSNHYGLFRVSNYWVHFAWSLVTKHNLMTIDKDACIEFLLLLDIHDGVFKARDCSELPPLLSKDDCKTINKLPGINSLLLDHAR